MSDIFKNEHLQPRVLRGVSINSNSLHLAELAGLIGFEAVWLEIEHGSASFSEVGSLCLAAEAGGALPVVRVQDQQRNHVLRALEVGARIVVVPMVNDASTAREVVKHGRFPPAGHRGYNTLSRGVKYGLEGSRSAFQHANERTHLFVQIETIEAVQNLNEICGVPGLSGVFIGPGDLSVSANMSGDFTHPEMISLVVSCVEQARSFGKHCGILAGPGPLLDAAMLAGCDLVICGGDIMDLRRTWRSLLSALTAVGKSIIIPGR